MGELGDPGLRPDFAHCGVGLTVDGDHLLVNVPGGLVVARSVDRCRRGGRSGPGTGDRRPGRGARGVLVRRGAGIGPGRPGQGGRHGAVPSLPSRLGLPRWRRS